MALQLRRRLRHALFPIEAAYATHKARGPNPPRFTGAFPDRTAALASLPLVLRAGYDDENVAEVSFDKMCEVASWDYPVLFWLRESLRPGLRVVDAGGHMGTKYIAFQNLLNLSDTSWTVHDLPGIIRAARQAQAQGRLPGEIAFEDTDAPAPPADLLLASGLLQYLDTPVATFLAQTAAPRVILNKVALRDGPTVVTLETIGAARVPYQIRNRSDFEQELAQSGYKIRDQWEIPTLRHSIATHPHLGASQSRGYFLQRL